MSEHQDEGKEKQAAPKLPPIDPDPYANAMPLNLPPGILAKVDYLLRHPTGLVASIRQEKDLYGLAKAMFVISLVMGATYGAVMGASNWLQGSELSLLSEIAYILSTAIKVPVLFLVTLLIVLPPIYISSIFTGIGLSFRQMLTLLVSAVTLTTIVLASMATVAFFFALTTRSYEFIKVLHVAFFAYAGLAGLMWFARNFFAVSPGRRRASEEPVVLLWLLLYGFVGTQMAWVLRPFIGTPGMSFSLFRERTGNFYENLYATLQQLL